MKKVEEIVKELNLGIKKFDQSTRTAAEAAAALGCEVAQIAKSLIFRDENDNPVLIIASGVNRVNEQNFGKKIFKADADFVRSKTGYVIGGVPPFGFENKIETYIDKDLLKFEEVWAAAGTPNTVFKIKTEKLIEKSGAKVDTIG